MVELAPLLRDQRKVDAEHLRILEIFHYVFAGLAVVGISFLGFHYFLMHSVLSNPALMRDPKGDGLAAERFFALFIWFYVVFGALLLAAALANYLSGSFIRQRKSRTFSLVVAGLNCVQIPFGTALGVFTIVVLLRDSVRELYDAQRSEASAQL
jgi:hypothetical protein